MKTNNRKTAAMHHSPDSVIIIKLEFISSVSQEVACNKLSDL